MSKKFKNKPCVYCLKNSSTGTGDHVFAREFFMEDKRDNLPKVPACERCNNEKSQLEHYLTAVLPFGGRHPDATANLQGMVPDRLAKNARLHRELAQGSERALVQETAEQTLQTLTVPFDGEILERLFHFIVKGLVFYHWGASLVDQHGVRVITLTEAGQEAFSLFLNMNARQRVSVDLGGGTFHNKDEQFELMSSLLEKMIVTFNQRRPHVDVSKTHPDQKYHSFLEEFRGDLLRVFSIVKHSAFREENEWRIVSDYYPRYTVPEIKFREGASMLVPYIELVLADDGDSQPLLDEVILGPSQHADLSMNALSNFLRNRRACSATANCSIPYRKWSE